MEKKELLFTNDQEFVWNKYVENAVELFQSQGIANPTEYQLWNYIDHIVEDFIWAEFDSQMDELFGYSEEWIIQQTIIQNNCQVKTAYSVVDSWESAKRKFLCLQDLPKLEVYDIDGELQINVVTQSENYEFRIRKLSEVGQHQFGFHKNRRATYKSLEELYEELWGRCSICAYFVQFRDGGTIEYEDMSGHDVTMEVRHHG